MMLVDYCLDIIIHSDNRVRNYAPDNNVSDNNVSDNPALDNNALY